MLVDSRQSCAHPPILKSPACGAQWSRGIIGLAGVNSTRAASTIVMGDLNANLHHPSFRALLRSGLRDATLSQGTGRIPTFPIWSPWPRLELDHIVFSNGLKRAPWNPSQSPAATIWHLQQR